MLLLFAVERVWETGKVFHAFHSLRVSGVQEAFDKEDNKN